MDLINHPNQVAARDAIKAQFAAQPTPASASSGPGEFGEFETLAAKLLQVPKKELTRSAQSHKVRQEFGPRALLVLVGSIGAMFSS
ncbi:MAG TPA: hypothetical protein VIJ20_04445 [Solirubrobacteraceae bacterium]